jgi:hydroxymethylpyrimidine pyrophosphatase-like HAD family hydrolase
LTPCRGPTLAFFSLRIAYQRVVERLGFAREDVIAFGDGPNDLELLRYAGKGVLMANADPRLRAALPCIEVVGSNGDELVAAYLQAIVMAR